jgi:hypothetical protein
MSTKPTHGGARKGAGAPRKEPTVVMRIPESLVDDVEKLIARRAKKHRQSRQLRQPAKS